MKWLSFFVAWMTVSAGPLWAGPSPQFLEAKQLCIEKYPAELAPVSGTTSVRRGRPFERLDELSDHFLKGLSPTVAAYRVTVFNPMSIIAGPRQLFFALIISGAQKTFLEGDRDVVAFLNSIPSNNLSRSEAVDRVRAFLRLRNYRQPFFSGLGVQQLKYGGWSIDARLITDAEINCRMDFTFDIQADGHFDVKRRTFVSADRYYR